MRTALAVPALLSLLTGCVSAPPLADQPFAVALAVVLEYRGEVEAAQRAEDKACAAYGPGCEEAECYLIDVQLQLAGAREVLRRVLEGEEADVEEARLELEALLRARP